MSIKVLIWRKMSNSQIIAAQPYLSELASLARKQPGYISGKTLVKHDDPDERLIICTWKSLDAWEHYNNLEECKKLHFMVDQILVKPTIHTVYIDRPVIE